MDAGGGPAAFEMKVELTLAGFIQSGEQEGGGQLSLVHGPEGDK